jgi:transposase InsO family protein
LAPSEVATIKDMVLDAAYRHMSVRALALHAERIGKVFASVTSWARLIRERGWRRPRTRVLPRAPTTGIRASRPNEYWHVDATIVRLLDGSRAYVHAVIDNFSRKLLAWMVADRLEPSATAAILVTASKFLEADQPRPTVLTDAGVENVNATVDSTLLANALKRVLAQVEVTFSNSMIEALWRSLKHQWLFLYRLESPSGLRTLVVSVR